LKIRRAPARAVRCRTNGAGLFLRPIFSRAAPLSKKKNLTVCWVVRPNGDPFDFTTGMNAMANVTENLEYAAPDTAADSGWPSTGSRRADRAAMLPFHDRHSHR
jgi:hypothetical protein